MTPLNHPYKIVQRHAWRPDSPWRVLKPSGAGRPYTPLLTDPEGAEITFRSYRDVINRLIELSLIKLET